jgi:hypothetical protein
MAQNCSLKIYQCKECNYSSNKNFNLIRHQYAKHKYKYQGYMQINTNGQNVIPIGQNVIPIGQNVIPSEQNVISEFSCKKCSKIYKTKKNLLIHESKCNGVDDLTCPRCMASFTTRQNKSRHIIKNNCKPRSIMHARKPNPNFNNINTNYNIENQNNNIETQNNIEKIETQNNNTNNIYINNYGNERLDYINYEKMLKIFKNAYDIPRLLTKEMHFNKEFPENNNILYKNETNALIKVDDEFILKDLNSLADELVNEKTSQIQKFALENKEVICTNIETQKYQDMVELLLNFILLKEPQEHYKKQIKKIKDMIKNSNSI